MLSFRKRQTAFSALVMLAAILYAIAVQSGWIQETSEQAQQPQPGFYGISRFVDGDTIAVDMNGSVETIRMIGVDTPETHKPNAPVQCYGPEAAAFTKQLIGQNQVRLEADPLGTNRDRYGRLLRYVYLSDGRLIETELISNGYSFAYVQFPFEKVEEFKASEQTAKAAKKGLWTACQVTVEADGRQQTNNTN